MGGKCWRAGTDPSPSDPLYTRCSLDLPSGWIWDETRRGRLWVILKGSISADRATEFGRPALKPSPHLAEGSIDLVSRPQSTSVPMEPKDGTDLEIPTKIWRIKGLTFKPPSQERGGPFLPSW